MATLNDIAKMAGVSTATVSRIINGKGEASSETIERVMQIAKDQGYLPSKPAKAQPQEASDVLVVVLPNLANPFFGEFAAALEGAATAKGIRLLIRTTNDSRENVEAAFTTILEERPFGAVISSMNVSQEDLGRLEDAGIHTITVDRASFEHSYSAIVVDQENGFYIGTKHLIENGCKKIIFLSSPKELELTASRQRGYTLALKILDQGAPTILEGSLSLESGYEIVSTYIKAGHTFDGIISCNDLMAIGAMRACAEHGLAVPKDIKIVGNDNLELDNFLTPPLTSISQKKMEVCSVVIDEMMALKNKETLPKRIILQSELMIRESSVHSNS